MSYEILKVDDFFYRSPRPTYELLLKYKFVYDIEAVLNLEGDALDSVNKEKGICTQLNIDESFISMSGIQRPPVNALIEGVNFILSNQKVGITTLVHCKWGINRTGMICAAYRIIVQGWTVDASWVEALSIGSFADKCRWVPLLWWRKSLVELKGR